MHDDGRRRVVIEKVTPQVDCGRFPIKRVAGERVTVQADVFTDGHDEVSALLLHREAEGDWNIVRMIHLGNDRWEGSFIVRRPGTCRYTIQGYVDHFRTFRKDLGKKWEAGQDVSADLLSGLKLVMESLEHCWEEADRERLAGIAASWERAVEPAAKVRLALSEELFEIMDRCPDLSMATVYERELSVTVDRERALFSTWYEFFPRSMSLEPGRHGTFADCEAHLPELARMGFDVLYLPPIHPIGRKNRKGKNNNPLSEAGEPGCPWAIGAVEGGHTAVHPELGTTEDFTRLVRKAAEFGIEIALDVAFQCAPDHPYVGRHKGWFKWRPDGSIQYAENPPKKYEDVVPFHFETDDWRGMWDELLGVFRFWIDRGVKIFRVDNPHTKPFPLWEYIIGQIRKDHPEVIFLSEAFTRPKVMYRLAKLGFTQSYTYFTWRTTKNELTQYLTELTQEAPREFFRPNFWPNTPDILHEFLQIGGRPAFVIRLLLAGTLSSSYGIYGPPYELCINEPMPGREEYKDSEKYEIKHWDLSKQKHIRDLIARLNGIRKAHPSLQTTWNIRFYESDNHSVIFFGKFDEAQTDLLFIAISLDPFHPQRARLKMPVKELGIPEGEPYMVHDLLTDERYIWDGEWNEVELEPGGMPGRIYSVKKRIRREYDFDYY